MNWYGAQITQSLVVQIAMYTVIALLIANFFQPFGLKSKIVQTWGKFRKADPLIRAGGWATAIFFLFCLVLFGFETCEDDRCGSKFQHLVSGTSNEVGDTLAGLAGSLAFLWIIVTVLLQGKELAAQREVLRLTRDEMEEQRKATQDMARSLAAQAEIFEHEKTHREHLAAQRSLDQLFMALRNAIVLAEAVGWTIRSSDQMVRDRMVRLFDRMEIGRAHV